MMRMPSAAFWLRAAAILSLLFTIGHSAGRPWTPKGADQARPVIEAMQGVQFPVMGQLRSFWMFYQGFGIDISVLMAAQTLLLWLLAPLARQGVAGVRPIIAVQLVAVLGNGLVALFYIFAVPIVFSVAIALCLALAILRWPQPR
jgi:hypothetical protein